MWSNSLLKCEYIWKHTNAAYTTVATVVILLFFAIYMKHGLGLGLGFITAWFKFKCLCVNYSVNKWLTVIDAS